MKFPKNCLMIYHSRIVTPNVRCFQPTKTCEHHAAPHGLEALREQTAIKGAGRGLSSLGFRILLFRVECCPGLRCGLTVLAAKRPDNQQEVEFGDDS